MLDHLDDLDADFLAVWGIDLRDPDCGITAERFFALAFRTFAYRGVMREELLAEQRNNEDRGPPPTTSGPTPSRQAPAGEGDGAKWVSPEEMKAMFPDLCG